MSEKNISCGAWRKDRLLANMEHKEILEAGGQCALEKKSNDVKEVGRELRLKFILINFPANS